jgi:hypothetical protein
MFGPLTTRGFTLLNGVYPVPQNASCVSAGMNVLKFPKGKP